jgi:hypothetical protein
MTIDEMLERGLTAAAADYDVRAGGVDRLREQLAPAEAKETKQVGRPSKLAWRLSGHNWMGIAAALLIVLIIVPFAIGGSGGGSDEAGSGGGSSAASTPGGVVAGGAVTNGQKSAGNGTAHLSAAVPAPAVAPPQSGLVASGTAGFTSGAGNGASPPQALVPIPPTANRVVKTGELDLQVGKGQVSATLIRLADLATAERGYIADSRTDEAGAAPSGQVTLRVPVDRFEDAVHQARSIAGTKVLGLQTSGEDVTSKYVDLQARIRALQATRSTFLTILSKATTIGETLSVQQRITDVQTQIEQLQGQLRVLSDSTAMSTLTVTVDQKRIGVAPKRPHQDNGFVKAVKLSVSRFVRGIEAIVGIVGPILLVLLIAVLGWLAARFGYRATRRHLV